MYDTVYVGSVRSTFSEYTTRHRLLLSQVLLPVLYPRSTHAVRTTNVTVLDTQRKDDFNRARDVMRYLAGHSLEEEVDYAPLAEENADNVVHLAPHVATAAARTYAGQEHIQRRLAPT
jgi:hypothetical protein